MIFFHALSSAEVSEGLTERRRFQAGHTRDDRPVLTDFENMGGRRREDSLSPVNTHIRDHTPAVWSSDSKVTQNLTDNHRYSG